MAGQVQIRILQKAPCDEEALVEEGRQVQGSSGDSFQTPSKPDKRP